MVHGCREEGGAVRSFVTMPPLAIRLTSYILPVLFRCFSSAASLLSPDSTTRPVFMSTRP